MPTTSSNRAPADRKIIASNRKARHDYSVLDTYEAGVVLMGTEVKALREGRASLVDGFATIDDGEVWLQGVHIAEYAQGTWTNHAPAASASCCCTRPRSSGWSSRSRRAG